MALTLRLSDEEQTALRNIQSFFDISTSSGAIKHVLLDWQRRQEIIMDYEKMLFDCKYDLQEAQSELKRIRDSWSILQSILEKSTPRNPPTKKGSQH